MSENLIREGEIIKLYGYLVKSLLVVEKGTVLYTKYIIDTNIDIEAQPGLFFPLYINYYTKLKDEHRRFQYAIQQAKIKGIANNKYFFPVYISSVLPKNSLRLYRIETVDFLKTPSLREKYERIKDKLRSERDMHIYAMFIRSGGRSRRNFKFEPVREIPEKYHNLKIYIDNQKNEYLKSYPDIRIVRFDQ